jgi:hypothetical protein
MSSFLPFMGREHPEVAGVPMALAPTQTISSLFHLGERRLLHNVQSLIFRSSIKNPAARFTTSSSMICSRASFSVSLLPRHNSCLLLCPLIPLLGVCQVPYNHVLCAVQEWHSRSTIHGWWLSSARTHHRPGSVSSAVRCTLLPNASTHVGPPVPR